MESHWRHSSKRVAMAEEDRLSSLPDDLLHSILRALQLKHAARTSALSRRWARQWLRALASSPVIDFTDRDFARRQPPARAAATVGRCLRLHAEHGAPLDAFRVALTSPSAGAGDGALGRDVVGWVAAAVRRGAGEVDVDLTPEQGDAVAGHGSATALLELPGDVFLSTNSLARLALGGFSLRAFPPGSAGLAGLRSLSLSHTDVTDEAVRGVLATCPALEFLSLRSCPLLASVRVAGERLRVLELVSCRAMRELQVAAPALESFVFHGNVYLSASDYDPVDVDMGATPALREAYLSHLGFEGYHPSRYHHELYNSFLYNIAHARILTLCSVGLMLAREQQNYDETAYPEMPNLQELQLLMASLEDDDLDHVYNFFMLAAPPLLDRLFVRLPGGDPAEASPAAAAALTCEDDADIVLDYEVVLDHLTLIKVVNFRGTRCELRLLRFLLNRAPVLEQLVLVTAEEQLSPGDEHLEIIRGRVAATRKASPEARVAVCRPSEARSPNPAHTKLYHEE